MLEALMFNYNSLANSNSASFEKVALKRLRHLAPCIPQLCQVFREPWGNSTVLCLNFADCPHLLDTTTEQIDLISTAAQQLGLTKSVIFRVGQKVMGWKTIVHG